MTRLTEMELFVHAAELGSLSRAAEAMNISNAAASRHLARLEQRLSAKLIERNTRRLFLTGPGTDFYRRCKGVLLEIQEAEAAVNATTLEASGVLTITASISFAMKHIAPLLPEFMRRYPKIQVQLRGANRYYDIIDSGIDLAIRTREFEPDSNITIRRLCGMRRILAASPSYLDQYGIPASPEELSAHRMLLYSYANNPNHLNLTRQGQQLSIFVESALEANDGQIIRAAALEGLGILVQPQYVIYDDVVAGRLVPVLSDWRLPPLTVNIAFQSRRYMPAKTRVFIDFLVAHFKSRDYERKWAA